MQGVPGSSPGASTKISRKLIVIRYALGEDTARPRRRSLTKLLCTPPTEAWFDPSDNWKYVGGEFNRYFRGPHVFQVLMGPIELVVDEGE